MNNPPSRLGSVVEGLAGCEFVDCSPDTLYSTLEVDSRKVGPGTVFVAVRGATFDAHDYIEQVARAGAVAVIAQRGACARPPGPHVWIDSTSASLATIAARHFGHPARQTALVGITGTNGKTTCTHLVSSILAEHKRLHFRLGTTGNWIVDHESKAAYTTPPPLELQALIAQAVRNGAHHGVMEVSSHALIQGRVDTLAFRAIGLTSFSQDHLDFHTNLTDYLAAKCKLATHHLDFTGSEPPLAVAHAGDGPNARAFLDQARRHGARTVLCSRAGVAAHSIEAAGDHTHDQPDQCTNLYTNGDPHLLSHSSTTTTPDAFADHIGTHGYHTAD